jgi:hypothetical protein
MKLIKYLAVITFVLTVPASICFACTLIADMPAASERLIGVSKSLDWCYPDNIIMEINGKDLLSPGYAFYKENEKWFLKHPAELKRLKTTEQDFKDADEFFRQKVKITSKKAKRMGSIPFIVILGDRNEETYAVKNGQWFDRIMKVLLSENAVNMAQDESKISLWPQMEGNTTTVFLSTVFSKSHDRFLNNEKIISFNENSKTYHKKPAPIFVVGDEEEKDFVDSIYLDSIVWSKLAPLPDNIKKFAEDMEELLIKRENLSYMGLLNFSNPMQLPENLQKKLQAELRHLFNNSLTFGNRSYNKNARRLTQRT